MRISEKDLAILYRLNESNSEIVRDLGLSSNRYVEKRIEILIKRFKANNRTDLAIKAIQMGIIKLPQPCNCECHTNHI